MNARHIKSDPYTYPIFLVTILLLPVLVLALYAKMSAVNGTKTLKPGAQVGAHSARVD